MKRKYMNTLMNLENIYKERESDYYEVGIFRALDLDTFTNNMLRTHVYLNIITSYDKTNISKDVNIYVSVML